MPKASLSVKCYLDTGWGGASHQCIFGILNQIRHSVLVNCVFWEDEHCQSNAVSLCKNMSQDLIEIQHLSRQS